MNTPEDLLFTKTHEWVKITPEGTALVGLSDHAQETLGDVAFINLCDEGEHFAAGDILGDVESIKAVSDIMSPVEGTVLRVNDDVLDDPGKVNADPYGSWLVELEDVKTNENLLTAADYDQFLKEESN